MASESPVVLLVSYDSGRLRSRSEILASLGLWTLKAQSLCEAVELLELLGQTRCDLVAICHSITASDQQQLIAYLLTNYPWIKFAVLGRDDDKHPERFVETFAEVLESGHYQDYLHQPQPRE